MANDFTPEEIRYLKASVGADREKGKQLHMLLISQVDRLPMEKLRGRKSNPYISIDGKVCKKIWKGRKTQGAVESEDSVRVFVSNLWQYGVAPFLKTNADDELVCDMKALKADTKKWASGEKSVWKQGKKRTASTRTTYSPPEKFEKWFTDMSEPNQKKFMKTVLCKKIVAMCTPS